MESPVFHHQLHHSHRPVLRWDPQEGGGSIHVSFTRVGFALWAKSQRLFGEPGVAESVFLKRQLSFDRCVQYSRPVSNCVGGVQHVLWRREYGLPLKTTGARVSRLRGLGLSETGVLLTTVVSVELAVGVSLITLVLRHASFYILTSLNRGASHSQWCLTTKLVALAA